MARTIDYDDKNLQRLFAELEPKRRLQAIKGGFRREANQVRKTAINNLRSSIQSNKDLEKGVRAIVFKRSLLFLFKYQCVEVIKGRIILCRELGKARCVVDAFIFVQL